mgnify:CR=1 FL=1
MRRLFLQWGLIAIVFALVSAGCGPDVSGSLRLLLVNADREAHQNIRVDPEFVEIEIIINEATPPRGLTP